VDEWARAGQLDEDAGAPPTAADEVVRDRRAVTLLVRNALFARVRLAAHEDWRALGDLDQDWGWGAARWRNVLDAYYEEHEEILLDADARSVAYFEVDEADERTERVWHVRQMFHDPEGYRDFGIAADLVLDDTQEAGAAVFDNYRAGSFEDLA
jgi:hypothetical protein